MKCLVCHQEIIINRFHDFLSLNPLELCDRCESSFIQKKGPVLFEDNDWLQQVIARLEKGDMILIKLFLSFFEREAKRQLKTQDQVTVLEFNTRGPYPWFSILMEQVKQKLPSSTTLLLVSAEKANSQTIRLY